MHCEFTHGFEATYYCGHFVGGSAVSCFPQCATSGHTADCASTVRLAVTGPPGPVVAVLVEFKVGADTGSFAAGATLTTVQLDLLVGSGQYFCATAPDGIYAASTTPGTAEVTVQGHCKTGKWHYKLSPDDKDAAERSGARLVASVFVAVCDHGGGYSRVRCAGGSSSPAFRLVPSPTWQRDAAAAASQQALALRARLARALLARDGDGRDATASVARRRQRAREAVAARRQQWRDPRASDDVADILGSDSRGGGRSGGARGGGGAGGAGGAGGGRKSAQRQRAGGGAALAFEQSCVFAKGAELCTERAHPVGFKGEVPLHLQGYSSLPLHRQDPPPNKGGNRGAGGGASASAGAGAETEGQRRRRRDDHTHPRSRASRTPASVPSDSQPAGLGHTHTPIPQAALQAWPHTALRTPVPSAAPAPARARAAAFERLYGDHEMALQVCACCSLLLQPASASCSSSRAAADPVWGLGLSLALQVGRRAGGQAWWWQVRPWRAAACVSAPCSPVAWAGRFQASRGKGHAKATRRARKGRTPPLCSAGRHASRRSRYRSHPRPPPFLPRRCGTRGCARGGCVGGASGTAGATTAAPARRGCWRCS
jgi:hypothetical protein